MKSKRIYFAAVYFAAALTCFPSGLVQARYLEARFPGSSDFSNPKNNQYFPKTIGLTYEYKSENKDTIVVNDVTTTFNKITIQGIVCPVVYGVEWTFVKKLNKKFMTKETYTFNAWDNQGNVWCFGQDSLRYLYNNNWKLFKIDMSESWLAGKNGALPGIVMPANPKAGVYYEQGYLKGKIADIGKVLLLDTDVSVALGAYNNCLKTEDRSLLLPGIIEHNLYAPSIGLVFVETSAGTGIKSELVNISKTSESTKVYHKMGLN